MGQNKNVKSNQVASTMLNIEKADNDTAYYCAFNFPAVLKAMGTDQWAQQLKPMHD